ncbi:MAG: fimbrillin family protein [Alistipes onderdonkii]
MGGFQPDDSYIVRQGRDEALQPADDAIRFDDRIGIRRSMDERRTDRRRQLCRLRGFRLLFAPGQLRCRRFEARLHVQCPGDTPRRRDWIYSPTKYWPQGKVSFFAYAPYDTDAAVSVSCGTGAPRVTYAVPDAVADHRDLLLSAPALDRTKEGGRVPLTFRHALAAVVFEASVDGTLSEGQSIRITGIRLGKFLHKATCHHELPDAITQTLATDAADREYALSEADGTLRAIRWLPSIPSTSRSPPQRAARCFGATDR